MANLYANLPLPAFNGPGTAVSTSGMGTPKTITCAGIFPNAAIAIEASVDGGTVWAPIAVFQSGDNEIQAEFSATHMRAHVSGRNTINPFSANIDVGALDAPPSFISIPVPSNVTGPGAAVNVSTFGVFSTFISGGLFAGAVLRIEISEDNISWAPLLSFSGQGGIKNRSVTAKFIRANVSGHGITATLAMGSAAPPVVIPGGSVASTCRIFRPGSGLTGPGVFDDYDDLYAQLQAQRATVNGSGCYVIEYDDSIVSPCVIPSPRVYDFTMVTHAGILNQTSFVQVNEGTTFQQFRSMTNGVAFTFTGTTPPVSDFTVDGDIVVMDLGSEVSSTGAGPFFRNSMDAGQIIIVLNEGSVINTGATPSVDTAVAGGFTSILLGGTFSVLNPDTLSSALGSVTLIATGVSGLIVASETQPGVLGVLMPLNVTRWRINPIPLPPEAPITADTGLTSANTMALVDPSGAAFPTPLNITLPVAGGADVNRGQTVVIKHVGVSGRIRVLANGSDTIDGVYSGSNGLLFEVPGGIVAFISDGVDTWRQSTMDVYAPPEQWAVTPIPANVTNVPMSCAVSTNFDDIKMIRPGSIIGIATRLTGNVTTGTLTVHVTVNGTNGTLQIIHNSGVHPGGGVATQRCGLDPYNGGALVGIKFTTTADFAPADTLNIEAWVEVIEFGLDTGIG